MVRELGRQLAALRRAAGLTQHQLAALTSHHGDIATRVTTTQPCPQCQHPVTVLTTLIPSPPPRSHPA
jgi:hypothetical protein